MINMTPMWLIHGTSGKHLGDISRILKQYEKTGKVPRDVVERAREHGFDIGDELIDEKNRSNR